MKIRQRNRIRRPTLAEFIRRGPFGSVTIIYTNSHGNRVFQRRRLKPAVTVTFGEASMPLEAHYTGWAI